ncbi:MAG: potassium transporter TrkH, partial [Fimbriimonadaceae bacterium]|nr:potassium transporter TrkH [Alphaproteobacteria bacterium]
RLFDAITHAMTTIATGGFSTHDASMGYFDSLSIDLLAVLFMIVGSLPFGLYLLAIQGKGRFLVTDSQIRWFFGFLLFFIFIAGLASMNNPAVDDVRRWQHVVFNIVSIMTGTGYATTDYGLWGGHAVAMFFFIAFIGGCAGSTSCGIKIFRFQVLFANVRQHINRIIYPNGVFVPLYNKKPLPDNVSASVLGFLFLFIATFVGLAISLSYTGLDSLTSFSSAASAIANVGPGLGEIVGPAGNFKSLPDSAKWIMSVGMLLGRLELLTVLVMFNPSFWQK